MTTGASSCAATPCRSHAPSPGDGARRTRWKSTVPSAGPARLGRSPQCSRSAAPAEERLVRILFHLEPAMGQRTGVGHYATELFRCLALPAAPDEATRLPTRWQG